MNDESKRKVSEVRKYVEQISGFKSISIIRRERNYGLAENIIDGVSAIVEKYGTVIVLEDDLVLDEDFLEYMNAGLNYYRDKKEVYSITGYSYIDKKYDNKNIPDYYFLPIICSWSWATWSDRWMMFDEGVSGYKEVLSDKKARNKFNYNGSIDYAKMLEAQMNNDLDSWAIRWYYSVFKEDGLTMYPRKSFVANAGFDGSGVHTVGTPVGGIILDNSSSINGGVNISFRRKLD